MDSAYSDPYWNAMATYAVGLSNNGFYKELHQTSPGRFAGLPLYSNEYSYLSMLHGNNSSYPYTGTIKDFTRGEISNFPKIQSKVQTCSERTFNPAGCQLGAVSTIINGAEKRVVKHLY